MKESNRRSFLRRIVTLTASAGVAGLLLDRLPGKSVIESVQATAGAGTGGNLVIDSNSSNTANTGTSTTELDTPGNPGFLVTNTSNGAALQGTCTAGTGVYGTTTTGTGVQGTTSNSAGTGVYGFASGGGTGVRGLSDTGIPVLAIGGGFEEYQFLKSGGTQLSRVHATGDGINRFAVNQSYDGTNFNLDNTADNGVSFLINSNPSASGIFAIQYIPAGSNPATSRLKTYMFMKSNGNVGIGTNSPDQLLSVNGNADKSSGGTAWGTFCDRRWKDPNSIRRFELGLEWVRTLPSPVRFRYAEGNGIGANPMEENVNFIAQDLQDGVHDNLVYRTRSKVKVTDKEPVEMYGVNVNEMHFAMVNAIKELAEQNQALREEVRLLKSRLDASEQTIKLAAS